MMLTREELMKKKLGIAFAFVRSLGTVQALVAAIDSSNTCREG